MDSQKDVKSLVAMFEKRNQDVEKTKVIKRQPTVKDDKPKAQPAQGEGLKFKGVFDKKEP